MNNVTLYDENGSTIDKLYQWDRNIAVSVVGVEPEHITAIHFANCESLTTPVVVPTITEKGFIASIPNKLLTVATTIYLYIYETIGTEGNRTTIKISLPVEARPKPDDYIYTETEVKTFETLRKELIDLISKGGATDEQLGNAIENYFEKNPFNGSDHRLVNITVLAEAWQQGESDGEYWQTVEVKTATKNTKVKLELSKEQIKLFHSKKLWFNAEQKNGVVTVTAFGQKPQNDYTLQAEIWEVYFVEQ